MDKTTSKYWIFCICTTIVLISLAVFQQVGGYEFVRYDDPEYVFENPYVSWGLSGENIRWAFRSLHSGTSYWHPLTWLSHMLDCEFFGLDAGKHHLVNLLIHIVNALLLFTVLGRMTGAIWRSGFAAVLFAIHPLHVESVAWVSERKDVLSSLFFVLTLWAYWGYVRRGGAGRYLPVILLFACGLMCKPMLVTLPVVLLLLDYWPLGRLKSRGSLYGLILEKAPLFFLSGVLGVVTFFAQRGLGAVAKFEVLAFGVRVANSFVSYVRYIEKMIWPRGLCVLYPHPGRDLPIWQGVVGAILLVVVTLCVIQLASRHKYLLTGWFWYLVMLLPVIGLVQVGEQAMADRYTYMSLTGLFIIVGWGADELTARWRGRKAILVVLSILIIFVLSVCSRIQVGYWRNSMALFERALDVTSNNSTMHYNVGVGFERVGEFGKAMEHYREAVRIKPKYAEAYYNLGLLLSSQGRFDEAISHYRQALKVKSDDAKSHYSLANALSALGNYDEAVIHYRRAIEEKADHAGAHSNLGTILAGQKRYDEAILHYRAALEIEPENVVYLSNLAQILATHPEVEKRDIDGAVALAERAVELTGHRDVTAYNTLAVVYGAAGEFERAISALEKAMELALAEGNEELAAYIRNQIKLYRQKRP